MADPDYRGSYAGFGDHADYWNSNWCCGICWDGKTFEKGRVYSSNGVGEPKDWKSMDQNIE